MKDFNDPVCRRTVLYSEFDLAVPRHPSKDFVYNYSENYVVDLGEYEGDVTVEGGNYG